MDHYELRISLPDNIFLRLYSSSTLFIYIYFPDSYLQVKLSILFKELLILDIHRGHLRLE